MRKSLRVVFTFLGIVALYPLGSLALACFSQTSLYLNIFGLRDGAGSLTTYMDLDADGTRDSSEPPLPGVCILSGYRPEPPGPIADPDPCHFEDYDVTDEQGRWGRFLPGGDCTMLYVFAVPPVGYRSTNTPAAKACSAQFGFVQENVPPTRDFPTVEEFARHERAIKLLRQLAIAAAVLTTASLGTWWLNKPPRV